MQQKKKGQKKQKIVQTKTYEKNYGKQTFRQKHIKKTTKNKYSDKKHMKQKKKRYLNIKKNITNTLYGC